MITSAKEERKKYYQETQCYYMISEDVSNTEWIAKLPKAEQAVIIMEGVSMYLKLHELVQLFNALHEHFENLCTKKQAPCYCRVLVKNLISKIT